jgi:ATP-dependent Clp protease ATP-binding subunit ClpC
MQHDRFDKFSQRARRVLALAQEEAQRFNHNYIGTEHLLLGLIREGDGVAAKVLSNMAVDITKVRNAVEFTLARGSRQPAGEIGLTPRARRVIELAVDEARRLGHHYIGTEHLLLGLVREGEGIASGVLESLNVNLERVRQQTVLELSHGTGGRASSTAVADTVSCRLDAGALAAVDALAAAGIRGTREEVVAWLVGLGLQTQGELLAQLAQTTRGEAPPPGDAAPGTPPADPPGDQPGPPPSA